MGTAIPSLQKFDLQSIHGLEKLEYMDGDFIIFETEGDTEFNHLVDFPTRPNAVIINVCTAGSCTISINLKKWEIKPNTLTVIAPDNIIQNHGMTEDYHAYTIALSSSFYEGIFSRQTDVVPLLLYFNEYRNFKLSDEESKTLLEYYFFMHKKIVQEENAYRRPIIQGLLTAMLFEFYNFYKTKSSFVEIKPQTRKEEIFSQFIKALSKNYQTERTVAAYADMLFLTPKHLSGVIKEVSGKTPGEWIDQRVILEAKALLKSSDMNIQQIAEQLHFTNQSFFGKYFRHHVGMSPKEYRRS